MIEFWRLIDVGLTSVFRRYPAVALVLICLPLAATAKIDETSSVKAALQLIDTFEATCSDQVEEGRVATKSHLVTLNADQVSSLSAVLGYREMPDAIWSPEGAEWYQVQASVDHTKSCLFVSFQISLKDMLTAWNTRFADVASWQTFSEASIRPPEGVTSKDGSRLLTGAFAFRKHDGHVIVAAVTGVQYEETGMVQLRYQKTGSQTDTCELKPETCN